MCLERGYVFFKVGSKIKNQCKRQNYNKTVLHWGSFLLTCTTRLLCLCSGHVLRQGITIHSSPLGHSMISGIPVRPWTLCNELANEASLDNTRNPCMAKEGVALTIPGIPVVWPGPKTKLGITSHPLTPLEYPSPWSQPEWNGTTVTGILRIPVIINTGWKFTDVQSRSYCAPITNGPE